MTTFNDDARKRRRGESLKYEAMESQIVQEAKA